MPRVSTPVKALLAAIGFIVAVLLVARLTTRTPDDKTPERAAASTEFSPVTSGAAPSPVAGDARAPFPHAIKDPAQREVIKQRLLAAAAEAKAQADQDKAAEAAGTPAPARGNRETNDIQELGKFIAQAIREDFIPMAKECAKELLARKPGVAGKATVTFTLLGDKKIGGVVEDSAIDPKESTLRDDTFETCVRESMYGVYFDPPPAGGQATLRFPVSITDGGIDEEVEDFHLKDRR